MKIRVTATDIRLGSKEKGPRSVSHCAVARALRRRFPKERIEVGFMTFVIGEKHGLLDHEVGIKIGQIMNKIKIRPFVLSFRSDKGGVWKQR